MSAVPDLGMLAGPLTRGQRSLLQRRLVALLEWQRRLDRWPKPATAPDATPIVSLYARGVLAGCAACGEGIAGERLARAFVLAVGDSRAMKLGRDARSQLVAQVAYPVRARRVSLDAAPRLIAPGAHGVALTTRAGLRALLVPDVARELGLDAQGLLAALEDKAGLERGAWRDAHLFVFETERVVARMTARRSIESSSSPLEAGVRWLAARVDGAGAVSFGVDPRAPGDQASGELRHARAAVVILALARHPAGRGARQRALRWLQREIQRGLAGRDVVDWPAEPALVAGTLALAGLAGIDVSKPLGALARSDAVSAHAWHAGQVALALGRAAPQSLWRACLGSLEREPRAPWIALAAAQREDWQTYERVATALAARIIEQGPQRGGVVSASIPETALTALVAEALALAAERSAPLRRAHVLACGFLGREQLLGDVWPEAVDAERVHGAFPLTPVHPFLRSDVTAHAVLALDVAR